MCEIFWVIIVHDGSVRMVRRRGTAPRGSGSRASRRKKYGGSVHSEVHETGSNNLKEQKKNQLERK